MGLNYQQALVQARAIGEGAVINVVISTNQDNGIVAYMQGQLIYHPSLFKGYILFPESMASTATEPLIAQFSDRTFQVGLMPQNFSVEAEDKIGLTITQSYLQGPIVAHFVLQNWGNAQYSITIQSTGDLLYGLGAPIGNQTFQALYTIAFISVNRPVVLH